MLKVKENSRNINTIRQYSKTIYIKINKSKKLFNEREKDSLIRVKNDLFHAIELINSEKEHETPLSIRKYCLVFIYMLPFLYTPSLISETVSHNPLISTIAVMLLSSIIGFILMALYNVQEYIENPFDQNGLDDIKMELFKVEKTRLLDY
jgi:hypothetical protein